MNGITGLGLLLIVILLFFIVGPALLLWSVGQMMQGEGLDFTFWNWLAAVVFLFIMKGSTTR